MRNLFSTALMCSLMIFLVACGGNESTESTDTADSTATTTNNEASTATPNSSENSVDVEAYIELDADMFLSEYKGQKVWIAGTVAAAPKQHVMKENLSMNAEAEKNACIDFNAGEQCMVYYTDLEIPTDGAEHKYYGTVDKVSGTGADGNPKTEFYLDLVKVD